MNKAEYMKFHAEACQRLIEITRKKNHDYSGAGDDPFSNFRQISGLVRIPNAVEIGFLTRMSDKMSRIGSYVAQGKLMVADESVDDTLLDLANYAILMLGYITEKRHYSPKQNTILGDYHGEEKSRITEDAVSRAGYGAGGVSSGDEPRSYSRN